MRTVFQHLILTLGVLVFLSDAQAQAADSPTWPATRDGLLDYSTRESNPALYNFQPPRPQPNFWTTPGMIRVYVFGGLLLISATKK